MQNMQSVSNRESQSVSKWEEIEDGELTDFSAEIEDGELTDFSTETEDGELKTDFGTKPDKTVRKGVMEYTHMEYRDTECTPPPQKEAMDNFIGGNKSKQIFDYFVIIDFEATCDKYTLNVVTFVM